MSKAAFQFQTATCSKLECILELEEQAKLKRKDLFDARDHADEELSALNGDASKREHLEADFGRCVREIKRWDKAIKRMDADLRETIKGARQLTLREEDTAQLKIETYLNAQDDEDERDGQDTNGRLQEGRRAPKVTKGDAAEGIAEGVDEHLKARVAELNLDSRVESCLTAGGFKTVADLVKHIDSPEGLPAIRGIGGVGEAEIKKAVKKFRSEHRSAMASAGA